MATEQSAETHIALVERDIQGIREELAAQQKTIDGLLLERNKALLWGVMTLGAFVITLLGAIVSFFKDHVK